LRYAIGQTDRQTNKTDRHTDTLIAKPYGSEVIKQTVSIRCVYPLLSLYDVICCNV